MIRHVREPRGLRNNNPGNLRRSTTKWYGLTEPQVDPDFCSFKEPVWGLRALALVIANYQRHHKINTVRGIISRYAPSIENDTAKYIKNVCEWTGYTPDQRVDLTKLDVLCNIVHAIVRQEIGRNPYSEAEYFRAVDLALNHGEL